MVIQVNLTSLAIGSIPGKNQPPLPVYPERIFSLKRAFLFFEMIAWRATQIQIAGCIVKYLQFSKQAFAYGSRYFFVFDVTFKINPKPGVSKAFYHSYTVTDMVTKIKTTFFLEGLGVLLLSISLEVP